jgi:carbamate kinase
MYERGADRKLAGVEAVIDKDLCSEFLAQELEADLLVMLTDADAVYVDWGKPTQRAIRRTSPGALAGIQFAAGSMGPKVEAACRFAAATGKPAVIGALADLNLIIAGKAGTTVYPIGATAYGADNQQPMVA